MIIVWSFTDFSAPQLGNLQLELIEHTAADKIAVQQLIDAFTKHLSDIFCQEVTQLQHIVRVCNGAGVSGRL